jgi:VWFA-related protein
MEPIESVMAMAHERATEQRVLTRVCNRIEIIVMLLLIFSCALLHPQTNKPPQKTSNRIQPTFKLPVDVIPVAITVTDHDGNAVTDLKQSEFKIYEDGRPQQIQTFALESFKPVRPQSLTAEETAEKTAKKPESAQVSTPTRPRMISILIDDIANSSLTDFFSNLVTVLEKYVEQDLGPFDQVALLSTSGRVQFPLISDRETLLEEIRSLYGKLDLFGFKRSDCPQLTDLQALNIEQTGKPDEVMIQETIACARLNPSDPFVHEIAKSMALTAGRTQNQQANYRRRALLNNLRQHLRSLRHFQAQKQLVLFSEGFVIGDAGNRDLQLQSQIQDVVDQALLSGVVLNTVDLRGLFNPSFIPPSDRPTVSVTTAAAKPTALADDALAKEDPLRQIANETRGIFYHNSNDLYDGLQKILNRDAIYYVLTYAIPSRKFDGQYHKIKVEISRPGMKLDYRSGYYTRQEEMTFESRKKEDLLDGLRAPGNLNEIPLELGYNYSQEDDSHYEVSFLVNVTLQRVRFIDEDSRHKNLISLVVVAFDENDHFIDGLEKSVDFRLTDSSYAGIRSDGLAACLQLRLTMGRYKIRAVVREGVEGKLGSLTRSIEIP